MSIRGTTIVLSHRVSESWWPWGTRMIMADRGCWAQWLWPGPWYHCDDNYIQLPSSTYLAYQRNDIILGLEHQPVLTHVAAPSHAHAPLVVDHVVHPSLTRDVTHLAFLPRWICYISVAPQRLSLPLFTLTWDRPQSRAQAGQTGAGGFTELWF